MINRIRVGVLLFKQDKLLMIRHVNPDDGYEWWVPPGGGIQDSETIYESAKREVYEEAGLKIKTGKPIYLRQFIYEEFKQNNIDIYITADIIEGKETIANLMKEKTNDSRFIKELRYFSEEEIQKINVFPKILQERMWKDRKEGFQNLIFFGIERDKE